MTINRITLVLCLAYFSFVPAHAAAEPELMAVLSVMGYGYKLKVSINGVDTGIEGGKSEGRRLFNKGNEMAQKATPQIRAKNFLLNHGANEIVVEYAKIDPKSSDQLEVKFEAEDYPQPVFMLTSRSKAADKVSAKVMLAPKAPANFKPVVFSDGK